MRSRCLLQVAVVLSSLVLSTAQNMTGPGASCLTSSLADGKTRVKFLREDAAGVRSLYLSLWSEDMRLLTCEVNSNPLVTERYRNLCDRSGGRSEDIRQRFDMSALLAPDAPCALVSSGAQKLTKRTGGDETERKTRKKRAWTLPGTLWCGSGSKAGEYEQLGMFESADRCCREHDHCLHNIPAFTANYGVFNPKLYTVSHCECDQRFRQCLMSVNDSIADMVGYSFFNILRVPCFELKQQKRCTEMYWWGMCKAAKVAPYAIFQNPLPYHKSADIDDNKLTSIEGQQSTESPMITPHRKPTKAEWRCGFREPPRGDTFYRKRTKGRGCKRLRKLYGAAPSQVPPLSRANSTTPASGTLSNKKRAATKKSTKKGLLDYILPQVTTTSRPQTASKTPSSTPPLTQRPTAVITLANKTTRSRKKSPSRSRCCESGMPVRGDTFLPSCKNCLKQATTSPMTTVTASKAATSGLPFKLMTHETPKKTSEAPKPDTAVTLRNAARFTTPITTELKTIGSFHKDGRPQKQVDSYALKNNTILKPVVSAIAQSIPAERSLKHASHNMTDNQLPCGSLKHLDECKFRIPPLEKKYNLQNMESKTAFHCDCTSRLAHQIEGLKQPSVLPSLLVDFVSPQCFTLPEEKKCHRKKRCSGGFTKASDLHQALKKMEEKDTAGVRISGYDRKRGIPVRLYKRCLRLERRADVMAQLR